MRILLDTNALIMLIQRGERMSRPAFALVVDPRTRLFASVVSLWEIAIKTRKGKLDVGHALNVMEEKLTAMRINLLPLTAKQSLGDADLSVNVKDPFDRMITAVAEAEDLMLLTTDSELLNHPLAWRP